MIKNSLKNFFKNLIYVFIPMGIVYLFLLLAAFTFLSSTISNLAATLNSLGALVGDSATQSSEAVTQFLDYSFGQINWSAPFLDTLKQILDTDWIRTTIEGFLSTLSGSTAGFDEQFGSIITSCVSKLKLDFGVLITISVTGIVIANFVTGYAVRRSSAKRNVKNFIAAHTVAPLMQSIVVTVAVTLLFFIKLYSLLVLVGVLLLAGIVAIVTSWAVYRGGGLKLKEVLTIKNILKYLASSALIIVITLAFAAVFMFINPIIGLLLAIPFGIYALNIIDVNTGSYISILTAEKIAEREREKAAKAAAEGEKDTSRNSQSEDAEEVAAAD